MHETQPTEETPDTAAGPADLAGAASESGAEPRAMDVESLDAEALAQLIAQAMEAEQLKDKIKRLEAEFVNETRRIRRMAENDRKFAIERVVAELLPVLDALHSAGNEATQNAVDASMAQGLALITRELAGLLDRNGVESIDPLGQPFDPSRHEALSMVQDPEHAPNSVCRVMRPGYALNGRVIRPAQVLVSHAPVPPPRDPPADAQEA